MHKVSHGAGTGPAIGQVRRAPMPSHDMRCASVALTVPRDPQPRISRTGQHIAANDGGVMVPEFMHRDASQYYRSVYSHRHTPWQCTNQTIG